MYTAASCSVEIMTDSETSLLSPTTSGINDEQYGSTEHASHEIKHHERGKVETLTNAPAPDGVDGSGSDGQGRNPPGVEQNCRAPGVEVDIDACHICLIPEGRWYRWSCTAVILILIVAILVLVALSLVWILGLRGVTLKNSSQITMSAIEVFDMSSVLQKHYVYSDKVCITDGNVENEDINLKVSLGKEKCSKVNRTKTPLFVPGDIENSQGLLFYWLTGTQFNLSVLLTNSTNVYIEVYLLWADVDNVENILEKCDQLDEGSHVESDMISKKWLLQANSSLCDHDTSTSQRLCTITDNVTETSYYYMCFRILEGKEEEAKSSFNLAVDLYHYDYNTMEICKAPCCQSYSDVFTELHDTTCMFVISNLSHITQSALRDPFTVKIETESKQRWKVYGGMVAVIVAMCTVTAILILCCWCSRQKANNENARNCTRHCFIVCSCYQLQDRHRYRPV